MIILWKKHIDVNGLLQSAALKIQFHESKKVRLPTDKKHYILLIGTIHCTRQNNVLDSNMLLM